MELKTKEKPRGHHVVILCPGCGRNKIKVPANLPESERPEVCFDCRQHELEALL